MSDADRKGAEEPQPYAQPSLDTLALAETLAQMRAADEEPRLSQLLAALNVSPDAAGPLADALLAGADADVVDEMDMADNADAGERAAALSPGTQRGLVAIFGAEDEMPTSAAYARDDADEAPTLVAETAVVYQANRTNQAYQAGSGLLDLARSRSLDAESLAAQVMLTPAALRWLDRIALPPERQPEALVDHLVGALGVERARVGAALAVGELLTEADAEAPLVDLLARDEALTPAQRNYWGALLSSST